MSQTITIELPDGFFQPLQRTAKATKQPIESLVLKALQISLPSLEGLPDEIVENLTLLETLSNKELNKILRESVPIRTQESISTLLIKNKEKSLSDAEKQYLTDLQREADLIMLRKARAAVLLRFRGQRLPTLAELEQEK